MNSDLQTMGWVAAALVTAMVVSLITTPVVKNLAFKVGAVDVPKDNRRMHDHPIPRMGGLAIFFGFILSALLYVEMIPQFRGMLLGGVIIVVLGIFDDIYALGAKFKLVIQIIAALVAVLSGNVIEIISNPNVFSPNPWWDLGWLSYPATVLWIVAITNAVNLIDGLDGLACGVSTISALTMLVIQIIAALVAVLSGNVIEIISNPNVFSPNPWWDLGWLSYPATVLWIVAITNAVNLIDGLDGLACGVSTISALTMLVISLAVADAPVAIVMAALAGACIGFLPYNLNPAKIFMGDTGSTFLGFILAVMSIQGLFKFYTIISFAVPFLMLGLPIFDTCFAFIRRIAHGQSPMHPDRSHVHHRLIDMGFNQKQAVAVLYIISAILGLCAVVLTTSGELKAMLLMLALCAAGAVSARIFLSNNEKKKNEEAEQKEDQP